MPRVPEFKFSESVQDIVNRTSERATLEFERDKKKRAEEITALKEARLAEIAATAGGEMERTKLMETGATQRTGMEVGQRTTASGQAYELGSRERTLAEKRWTAEEPQVNVATNIAQKYAPSIAAENLSKLQMENIAKKKRLADILSGKVQSEQSSIESLLQQVGF